MIFKIKKNLHQLPYDYVVKSVIGEVVCKTAFLPEGCYIYNKNGSQIAQIIFDMNTATMSVVKSKPSFPAACIIKHNGGTDFSFMPSNQVASEEDLQYTALTTGGTPRDLSVWGKVNTYNFDIYESNRIMANVIPDLEDSSQYQIRVTSDGNILFALMTCISIEMFLSGQSNKH